MRSISAGLNNSPSRARADLMSFMYRLKDEMVSATAGICTRRSRGREEKKSMMNLLGHWVKILEAEASGNAQRDGGAA